ncbi:MAG: hypothetical protein SFX18_02275 [Pirellulales bacterium]|nr:hypothetical protein [Pirellulales bacterium]
MPESPETITPDVKEAYGYTLAQILPLWILGSVVPPFLNPLLHQLHYEFLALMSAGLSVGSFLGMTIFVASLVLFSPFSFVNRNILSQILIVLIAFFHALSWRLQVFPAIWFFHLLCCFLAQSVLLFVKLWLGIELCYHGRPITFSQRHTQFHISHILMYMAISALMISLSQFLIGSIEIKSALKAIGGLFILFGFITVPGFLIAIAVYLWTFCGGSFVVALLKSLVVWFCISFCQYALLNFIDFADMPLYIFLPLNFSIALWMVATAAILRRNGFSVGRVAGKKDNLTPTPQGIEPGGSDLLES